jgi:LPS sulfotransferase NodH
LEKALATIDEKIVYQLRYETLLKDPVGQLTAILSFLGLRMTAEYRSAIESLRLGYRPSDWARTWTEDQLNAVLREQKATLQRFGYID